MKKQPDVVQTNVCPQRSGTGICAPERRLMNPPKTAKSCFPVVITYRFYFPLNGRTRDTNTRVALCLIGGGTRSYPLWQSRWKSFLRYGKTVRRLDKEQYISLVTLQFLLSSFRWEPHCRGWQRCPSNVC